MFIGDLIEVSIEINIERELQSDLILTAVDNFEIFTELDIEKEIIPLVEIEVEL